MAQGKGRDIKWGGGRGYKRGWGARGIKVQIGEADQNVFKKLDDF